MLQKAALVYNPRFQHAYLNVYEELCTVLRGSQNLEVGKGGGSYSPDTMNPAAIWTRKNVPPVVAEAPKL